MSSDDNAECIVVGAGLSGLAAATLLFEAGKTVQVLEARANAGGRIRSVFDDTAKTYQADLGPTWVWPVYQPTIAAWLHKLKLETFGQFNSGQAVIDYGPDVEPEIRFLPDQEGNMRIKGGPQAMIDALMSRLPEGTVKTGSPVIGLETSVPGEVQVQVAGDNARTLRVQHVVVAIPPRLASTQLTWQPAMPDNLANALSMMPTWMAPHAKVVALYEKPFWRDRGLSGRIASRVGPIVEGHDHCGPDADPAAIFGFIGWPPQMRAEAGKTLENEVRSQLMRCFGPDCPAPLSIHIEDWAADPLVTSQSDLEEPMSHPVVGPELLRLPYANGRIVFAGAESAGMSPGLIEGAFDAAERAAHTTISACATSVV